MIRGAFGRRPGKADVDTDLVAEGFGDLVAELRAIAGQAPAPSTALASRVLAALRTEAALGPRPVTTPTRITLFARLGRAVGYRPTRFRSVLAAAALTLALGAGAVFAANGGRLPFDLPSLPAPADEQGQQPTQVVPGDGDVDAGEDQDEDAAESPASSQDVDADENRDADEDDGDRNADEHDGNQDRDADEDDGDQNADEDEDSNDEDSSTDEHSNDGDDSSDDDESDHDGSDDGDDHTDSDDGEGGSDDGERDDSSEGAAQQR